MSLTDKNKFGDYPPYQVRQDVTSVLKVYPDFVRLIVLRDPFSVPRFDWGEKRSHSGKSKKFAPLSPEEIEKRAQQRARTKIQDLALANDFDMFFTFTFKDKRYDVDIAKRRMGYWLNNQRHLYGVFRYIIAPEYHKRCEACIKAKVKVCSHKDAPKALHFHALFGGYGGVLTDRNHMHKGRKKYDVDSYKLGMATAKKIDPSLDDHQKVASYVSKYITKDMPKFNGKQRYWRSNGLKLPQKIVNPLLTDDDKAKFTEISTKSKFLSVFELRGQLPAADIERLSANRKLRDDDLWIAEW